MITSWKAGNKTVTNKVKHSSITFVGWYDKHNDKDNKFADVLTCNKLPHFIKVNKFSQKHSVGDKIQKNIKKQQILFQRQNQKYLFICSFIWAPMCVFIFN